MGTEVGAGLISWKSWVRIPCCALKLSIEVYPEDVMPSSLKDELAKEDLEAVIAYLLTLK